MPEAARQEPGSAPPLLALVSGRSVRSALRLFAGFALLGLLVFGPALRGPFVSDDLGYVVNNPYVREWSARNVLAFFDPTSPAQDYAVGNYSPLHLLLHAVEARAFGEDVLGFHVVNVLVHAANATLLVALLGACGAPPLAALLAGLLFAVHPANVEAVAWISQLKSTAGLAFALGALLALRRRPGLGTALFAAGLLTKAAAAFALPMAAALVWARRGGEGGDARHWRWLALWTLLFAAYAAVEIGAFGRHGHYANEAFRDPWVHARTIGAIGARYLWMAATSLGVSAFHEPEPVRSFANPWWLASLPLAVLLGWRTLHALRRRREEGAFWLGAAASFVPVSQLFPFVVPMADRYLYFVLPGLLGGAVLWASELRPRLPPAAPRIAAACALALAAVFAVRSADRAALWQAEIRLALDAGRNYPRGGTAAFLRARTAAQRGDVEAAIAELRAAGERGLARFTLLEQDPGLAPIRGTEAFDALVREWAGRWIERAAEAPRLSPLELRLLGMAHARRGEREQAIEAYERALDGAGPLAPTLREELDRLRRAPE